MSAGERIRPSSAARIVQCPGSLRLSELAPPQEDTAATLEGTFAHAVVRAFATDGEILAKATDDMLDGAELWAKTLAELAPAVEWRFEEYAHFESVHPQNGGTPDAWCLTSDGELIVADYKFGHRYVDVFENWQLLNYVSGLAYDRVVKKATMCIVQPRCFHAGGPVRKWSITAQELGRYMGTLRLKFQLADSPNATCHVGPECRFCPARLICPTWQAAGMTECDVVGLPQPLEVPLAVMGKEYLYLKRSQSIIADRLNGLESELITRIKGGANVTGLRLASQQGRRHWDRPVAEVIAMGSMMGVDLAKPGVLTPAQAVAKGLPEELIAGYAQSDPSASKLVEDDAKRVFGDQHG